MSTAAPPQPADTTFTAAQSLRGSLPQPRPMHTAAPVGKVARGDFPQLLRNSRANLIDVRPAVRFPWQRVARLRHTDAPLSNDHLAPFSYDFAQRAGPVDLPPRHHGLPSNARTIVRNDLIANHPEAAHLEFGRKLSGSHVGANVSSNSRLALTAVTGLP